MFEILKEIKECWEDSKFIIIHNDYNKKEETYLAIPSQMINTTHINFIRNEYSSVSVIISDEFAKYLGLVPLEVMFIGLEVRYHIIGNLLHSSNNIEFKENYLASISHVDTNGNNSDKDIERTISAIGTFADQFKNTITNKYDFIDEFGSKFYIPGSTILIKSELGLFKSRVGIAELSIALGEITNNTPSIMIAPLFNSKSGKYINKSSLERFAKKHEIPIIDAKTTINLYRSINKIPKAKIIKPVL